MMWYLGIFVVNPIASRPENSFPETSLVGKDIPKVAPRRTYEVLRKSAKQLRFRNKFYQSHLYKAARAEAIRLDELADTIYNETKERCVLLNIDFQDYWGVFY